MASKCKRCGYEAFRGEFVRYPFESEGPESGKLIITGKIVECPKCGSNDIELDMEER